MAAITPNLKSSLSSAKVSGSFQSGIAESFCSVTLKGVLATETVSPRSLLKPMGFNKERGDTVSVANTPFNVTEQNDSAIPLWKDPETFALLRELFKFGVIAAILAYLLVKIILPLSKAMLEAPPRRPSTS